MKLMLVINADPKVAERMTFFLECFLFANEFLGRIPNLPFDTPESLIDKMMHQLKFNHKDRYMPYLSTYVEQLTTHFDRILDQSNLNLIESKRMLFDPLQEYTESRLSGSQAATLIEKNKFQIISALEALKEEFSFQGIDHLVDQAYRLISCVDENHDHLHDIILVATLLVCHFRFKGFSKSALDGFADRILSKDYSFPFSEEIMIHKNDKDKFAQLVGDFFIQLSLKDQISGFKNLTKLQTVNEGVFLCFLENIDLLPEHIINLNADFGDVQIIWSGNSKFDNLRNIVKLFCDKWGVDSPMKEYFGSGVVLGMVKMKYDTVKQAQIIARERIQITVDEFNNYLGYRAHVNSEHILCVDDLESSRYIHDVNKFKVHSIIDEDISNVNNNAYAVLSGTTSRISEILRRNEKIFARAWSLNDPSIFFQYLENLFWETYPRNAPIKDNFTKLALESNRRFMEEFAGRVGLLFSPIYFHKIENELGLDTETVKFVKNKLWEERNVSWDFSAITSKIKRRSVQKMFGWIEYYRSIGSTNEWTMHFRHLITELKDLRNSSVHAGVVNDFSDVKMRVVTRHVMNNIRWHLILACKNHPDVDTNEFWRLVGIENI